MIQVHTRDGIFGPGGYGGGVFDGSNMGFGGLGEESKYEQAAAGVNGLGVFPSPSKYPNGYPTPTYTTKSGETGSTIARDITGNQAAWKTLADANPSKKCAAYGMCFNPGTVLTLPASWVAAAGATATTATASIAVDDVAFMVDVVNSMLYDMGYSPISGSITQVNAVLCGAADFVSKQIQAGNKLLNAQDVADFIGLAKQYGATMNTLCQPIAPWPGPAKSGTPPPATTPAQPATPSANPCLVTFGSSGPVVAEMQKSMNVVLAKNGYAAIPVSGTWDAATCGAMFALEGEWDPVITSCPGGWQVPPGCPKGVTPVKPIKTDEGGGKSGASMAWMMGGLLGAAAIAGLVAARKKR